MVKGINKFKDHFSGYSDRYVLIGGAACDVLFDDAGISFRATKDLDIVLCIETLDPEFGSKFWEFVKSGGYENQQKSTGRNLFYRFYDPEDDSFPFMLELFGRSSDLLPEGVESHLAKIPLGESVSSLSAILLDDDYYDLLQKSKRVVAEVPIADPSVLIPFKAKAWLNLIEMKGAGEVVRKGDIKKHKADVFRLSQLLSADERVDIPDSISEDMRLFIDNVKRDENKIVLNNLGINNRSMEEILDSFNVIYDL